MNNVNVYKLTVAVFDFENQPVQDIIERIENTKYLSVCVHDLQCRQVSDWNDDHPLNKKDTGKQAFLELFREIE